MNKEIKIRPEQENDFQAVREVVELAFRDVEDSDQSEPYLVERLRKTDAYIPELSLVAELNGEIIGHLMMSKGGNRIRRPKRDLSWASTGFGGTEVPKDWRW